jgi:hypothetical protein
MKRLVLLVLVALALSSLIGCSGGGSKDAVLSSLTSEPAVTALAQQVGVTADQAVGGLGALLSMAKNKVSAEDFTKLTSGLPSAEKYMQAAGGMGIKGDEIKDVINLKDAYKKLGMSEQAVSSFSPAAINFVRSAGGEAAAGVLSSLGL